MTAISPARPEAAPPSTGALLDVRDLRTHFKVMDGVVRAVDGVSFSIQPGETLGVVGESGCGKSVTALTIMRLLDMPPATIPSGEIWFDGVDLLSLGEEELRQVRGNDIAMIFQEPMTSLNPVFTVGDQIAEAVMLHLRLSRRDGMDKAVESLRAVGINNPERRVRQYPHELSGGMRQRIMIAVALACRPKLLIADEPTTALDVTIQAGILDLLRTLSEESGTAVLLITHDLGVVADIADRVVVMYAGRTIEESRVDGLFASPSHPYTRGLLDAVPNPARRDEGGLREIPGMVPLIRSTQDCCKFADRCPWADDLCRTSRPALEPGPAGHPVACWHPVPATAEAQELWRAGA